MQSWCCSYGLSSRWWRSGSPMRSSDFASAIYKEGRRRCPRPEIQPFKPDYVKTHHLRRTNMEVILLERVAKLGQMGEVVRVKDGFARNFLLKRGKALRATADNRPTLDGMKAELQADNLTPKSASSKAAATLDG